MQGKECTTCKEWKPYSEYHKYKRMPDGYEIYCKACRRIKYLERSVTPERGRYGQREKVKSNQPKPKKEPKPFKPKKGPYIKKGYANKGKKIVNPLETKIINGESKQGKICTQCSEWKLINEYHKFARMPDGLEIYCKPCRKKHTTAYFRTEKGKNNSHQAAAKRRSRKKGVNFTPYERKAILRRDKYTCQFCGVRVHDKSSGNWNTPDKAHLDHIVSLEDGGNTTPENLQTLCRSCNLSKGSKSKGELQMTLF